MSICFHVTDTRVGLTNLSKYPASTVQILGAEKALFRALKTKGNTRTLTLLIVFTQCVFILNVKVYLFSLSISYIECMIKARMLMCKIVSAKYGLIYHSSFIGKASTKNKGRISRFLANKCSIASRIDNFSEEPTKRFGEALKYQVDERLKFYDTGAAPTKNELAMVCECVIDASPPL